ncbi:Uncharacterised protein [Klebsiella pneumoniae]|nr:Uncharacterised protein [Klebsiella pneumoniae]SBF44668.1 Uncharacterised protein [Klebsiella pneumoniae]SBF48621.1 Uncharacterised protein [Klebsiella pneumoniae]SBF63475.1 Uncharacterised protein [Klebsiella pneumoniae]SBF69218.1 Uncharacterised protein [Klebsiella pneumoniae]
MKSLSSSRREVLVDCFHVHACHISHLLPGCTVLQHSSRPLDNLTLSNRAIILHQIDDGMRYHSANFNVIKCLSLDRLPVSRD